MASRFADLLPRPKNQFKTDSNTAKVTQTQKIVKKGGGAPPYRNRRGFIPRSAEDYGDGGAFPEIHVAQYPLDMGRTKAVVSDYNISTTSQVLPLQVDGEGTIRYDALVLQGQDNDKIVHSRLQDMVPMDIHETDEFAKPSRETASEVANRTKEALDKIVNNKIAISQPKNVNVKHSTAPQYIRYTSRNRDLHEELPEQRVIRMVNVQEDPFEPPRFRVQKLPRGPPSPPVPVLHSPPRKVTVQEQEAWKIPPCISNWKNPKGYTIPLDKRLAADGRGLQQININDNFAKLSESLYLADRHAREEIEKRAALERKLAENEKKAKEEHLRQLAQKAREERSNLMSRTQERSRSRSPSPGESGARERERIRQERRKEREKDLRMRKMGDEHRRKMHENRDVSERVAMGAQSTYSQASAYDQRLFNQTEGLSAGFGDDDAYNLYDKPLFQGSSANIIYKPRKAVDSLLDETSDEVSSLLDTAKFKAYKGFKGADEQPQREGPVQFEKEEDPFGLDQFLDEAKGKSGLEERKRK